jgi:hypothetical protein
MEKELIEKILEIAPSTHKRHAAQNEALFESEGNGFTPEILEKPETHRLDGVVIGLLVGLKGSGELLVDFPANPSGGSVTARSAVALGKHEIGREVALLFEGSDPRRPIIMGLMQPLEGVQPESSENSRSEKQNPIELEVDGERLVLTANKEIILRCGKASITLTQAGKVLIRGTYLLSRSSGVNRIKGGSVQIN